MVQIFKAAQAEAIKKKGYTARYLADVFFKENLDSSGFILVTVAPGSKSEPHKHGKLEEVFVALTALNMYVDSIQYKLEIGDVVLVSPNESHSFEALEQSPASILAIKFPNLKSDKISMNNQ